MNHTGTAQEVLIIYENSSQLWATYLQSILSAAIPPNSIFCYNIGTGKGEDFLQLGQYTCKLLILSKGLVEELCQTKRFFLARVLSPASHVVVLLCGVDSLKPLLDLVPLNGEQCLQISSEQEPQEYLTAVTDIMRKGNLTKHISLTLYVSHLHCPMSGKPSGVDQNMSPRQSTTSYNLSSTIALVPSRVPCGSPVEVFLLLKNQSVANVTELEFSKENLTVKVKPNQWSDSVVSVNAPDFPAGIVKVSVLSNGVALNNTVLSYYSRLEEMSRLLSSESDPVQFMCQALHAPSVEKLDQMFSSMLLRRMPSRGFQGLQWEGKSERESHDSEVPTMLHLAAQHGLKSLSSVLLQCPCAERAVRTANRHGHTPIEIALHHGHAELHVLLQEKLKTIGPGDDAADSSVYEIMSAAGSASIASSRKEQREGDAGEGVEEDPYTMFGLSDACDAAESRNPAVAIANRPPAPAPRPQSTEDRISYVKAQGHRGNMTSLYDTFVAAAPPGLHQRVRAGSLPADNARDRVDGGQRAQKGAVRQPVERDRFTKAHVDARKHIEESGVWRNKTSLFEVLPVPAEKGRAGDVDLTESAINSQADHSFYDSDHRSDIAWLSDSQSIEAKELQTTRPHEL
ncbi:B-cell scaffold protein with ankyrin repeats-like [Eucyclogobius newberryi]|uniref:B-cell scaffold protein with ankyrin repeats-like n=1 Tax=Eucyclogobius newberryi TaxID=166745 RepID=UPI003B59C49A